jgi:hypothetical protein
MSKQMVIRRVGSQGALKGAPRDKPVVSRLGNRMARKPKGYRAGRLSKRMESKQ